MLYYVLVQPIAAIVIYQSHRAMMGIWEKHMERFSWFFGSCQIWLGPAVGDVSQRNAFGRSRGLVAVRGIALKSALLLWCVLPVFAARGRQSVM